MAQMLLKTDSAAKVERAVRRHLRLAKRTGNAKAVELAERIVAPAAAQTSATAAAATAREGVEDTFDDWSKTDAALDRLIKRGHRRCVDFDADHPGAGTAPLLFGGEPPSAITNARREDEPDIVAKLVARGAKLPADHPATPLLAELTTAAQASRTAERAWIDAHQNAEATAGAVEVARLAVIGQYRDNFIDIGRAAGADVAEACFPTLRRGGSGAGDDSNDVEDPTKTT
ncbi:MAG: hypothetical protein IT373_11650 [Polyangiaceae bacterium]|nr:hypothetical protein [Polyangiaceae bacterium]